MNLRRVLLAQLWPRRSHAWPLLGFTLPMYYFLLWALYPVGSGHIGHIRHVPGFCVFLSQAPILWSLAAVWLLVDLFLIVWLDRALNRGDEPAHPAKLFFLWQAAKLAFFFLFVAVLSAYGPLYPHFGLSAA